MTGWTGVCLRVWGSVLSEGVNKRRGERGRGIALHLGKVVNLFVFFHCGYFVPPPSEGGSRRINFLPALPHGVKYAEAGETKACAKHNRLEEHRGGRGSTFEVLPPVSPFCSASRCVSLRFARCARDLFM